MVSPRKIRANRRNARKSTGPRTAEGKQRASRNSITHGIYCRDLLLPGENEELFHGIRQDYIKTFLPKDLFELSLVDRIVADQWRLNRLQEAESWLYQHRRDSHQDTIDQLQDGCLSKDERVNEWWEKLNQSGDAKKDPAYIALCSAMGCAAMTMNSLMGDYECQLERYEKMRSRLHASISRATRELRALRPKGSPPPGPSPYCDEHNEELKALARAMDLDVPGDEEDEEDDEEFEADDEEVEAENAPSAPSTSTAQNEATEPQSTASTDAANACNEPPLDLAASMPFNGIAKVAIFEAQEKEMNEFLRDDEET